jgi:hypothetical protein
MAKDRAKADPFGKFVAELGIPSLGKARSDRIAALEDYFDEIDRSLANSFLLRLVAAFEAEAFSRLATAIGAARSTIDDHYPKGLPFAKGARALVRDTTDLPYLSDIQTLLKSDPQAPTDALDALREHRNKIAHGGRIGKESLFMDPEDVHRVLLELMNAILGTTQ